MPAVHQADPHRRIEPAEQAPRLEEPIRESNADVRLFIAYTYAVPLLAVIVISLIVLVQHANGGFPNSLWYLLAAVGVLLLALSYALYRRGKRHATSTHR